MQTRYIKRVGVELEGGWWCRNCDYGGTNRGREDRREVCYFRPDLRTPPRSRTRRPTCEDDPNIIFGNEWSWHHDGSVNVSATHVGEVVSPPLPFTQIGAWVQKHYPDVVNASCGMHVHMSLRRVIYYSLLVDPSYQNHILRGLRNWAETTNILTTNLRQRLDGANGYCLNEYYPERQLHYNGKSGSRYTAINYAWGCHQTVECRVLPAMATKEIAAVAVEKVIQLTEEFLEARFKEPRVARRASAHQKLVIDLDELEKDGVELKFADELNPDDILNEDLHDDAELVNVHEYLVLGAGTERVNPRIPSVPCHCVTCRNERIFYEEL